MSRAIGNFLKILAAPIAVPWLRSRREEEHRELIAVAERHGLPVSNETREGAPPRFVGRIGSRAVIVTVAPYPMIRVVFHGYRPIEVSWPRSKGTRVNQDEFSFGSGRVDRLFGTRFIAPRLLRQVGEERMHELGEDLFAFADRWSRYLEDVLVLKDCLVASILHYPFVPGIPPAVLDGMLPELSALAERCEAILGPSAEESDESKFLAAGEKLPPRPAGSVPQARDELLQE